ncbi:uncharacterized protein LOC119614215 isoform X2 [Lucilia sericata]|uniref:uncharacterized protein LOC119614215 isoform X2 n=1 Tax=Lucilia sericata TaxID=13632 RepID=UPI0018A8746B|nr:uncharacterized protein LOC119614215 isoform X2 [Lucilia sericata]
MPTEIDLISDSSASSSFNSNINNSDHDSSNNNNTPMHIEKRTRKDSSVPLASNLKTDRSEYLTRAFIKILKEETAIWKTDTEQYKDPNERKKSWKSLLAKYRKIDKNTRMERVQKKYNVILNAYKSELEKVHTNENLVPTLSYFEHINFLRNYLNDLLKKESQDLKTDRSEYLTRAFIEILKEETAIWKTDTEQYKDPNERKKSWESLLAKYRKIDKNTRMERVQKKYNVILNAYKSELEKVHTNENLVPTLSYFEHINFLRNYLNDLLKKESQDILRLSRNLSSINRR